jgi:sucrose phosphorylase
LGTRQIDDAGTAHDDRSSFERPWLPLLTEIYGTGPAHDVGDRVAAMLDAHVGEPESTRSGPWDERDAWLITYPDQFRRDGEAPLGTLAHFFADHLDDAFNGIHVLPFFPFTSDEGFSITDYQSVDERLGTWDDIETLGGATRLMVDAVLNHCSVGSVWFEQWRSGDGYDSFFRTSDPDSDLAAVVRARQHPLLTEFATHDGPKWVWTTFSPDQVDLDYRNPEVLLNALDVVLTYARHGAGMIRLDAVGFLWKEEGTPSIHLPHTHHIVQFLRACLAVAYPDVLLLTETNVPHAENVVYLGDGTVREAHAVYQFPLPPLTLHAVFTGNASTLKRWITDIGSPPPGTSFLNFLGSHDGVGLRPLEDIVDPADIEQLVAATKNGGGSVNSRIAPDGATHPYELNATWYDLIRGDTAGEMVLDRHLASHAIMLALQGIPAIYVQSLFAGRNDHDAVARTGAARSINRRRYDDVADLEAQLADPTTTTARSVLGLKQMLTWRRSSSAFHPDADQRILPTPNEVLGIERTHADGSRARVFVNVSDSDVIVNESASSTTHGWRFAVEGDELRLGPYGIVWVLDGSVPKGRQDGG